MPTFPPLPRPWLVAAFVALVGIGMASLFQADAHGLNLLGHEFPSLCIYDSWGHACPGCGFTRAGVLLLQGRVVDSLSLQPALPLFLLAALLGLRPSSPMRVRYTRGLALAGLGVASCHLFLVST